MKKVDRVMDSKVAIIGSQMGLGAPKKGADMGPLAIRNTGIIQRLRDKGMMLLT